jgi:hypothetical protein
MTYDTDLAAGSDPVLARAAELGDFHLDAAEAGKLSPFEWCVSDGPTPNAKRVQACNSRGRLAGPVALGRGGGVGWIESGMLRPDLPVSG